MLQRQGQEIQELSVVQATSRCEKTSGKMCEFGCVVYSLPLVGIHYIPEHSAGAKAEVEVKHSVVDMSLTMEF
jgi:hypothetical protein